MGRLASVRPAFRLRMASFAQADAQFSPQRTRKIRHWKVDVLRATRHRHDMPHEFKVVRRVEFAETDMAGIMHFANFFRLMEEAEHAFFRSLGFSIHGRGAETSTAVGWPRVSASCDFRAPLRFEEEVEIHLLVAEVRTRSIRYDFIFRRVDDGLEVARGRIAAVCAQVDAATGKLAAIPIPEMIRQRIEPAPADVCIVQS
jgi:acyl-CoA thioester hydrolase